MGYIGKTGYTGAAGSTGSQGATGAQGSTGAIGAQGATGATPNQNLANVLLIGNNAGTTGINMNKQNIYSANSIICDIGATGATSTLNPTSLNFFNGISITKSTIQYPSTFNSSGITLNGTTNYSQTFNGANLTVTLPTVLSTNVGLQFLITNTNSGNLTVSASSSQLIYTSISNPPSSTSTTLNTGHSQIFTAILTTDASTYGWSMV